MSYTHILVAVAITPESQQLLAKAGLCIQLVEHVFFDKRSDHFFVDLN